MALVHEGFSVYAVKGEVLSTEVEELIVHFIVTYNDKASTTAAKSVPYIEGLEPSVTFF